jgi:uncharacterized protein YjbI with pentapeptide repeats
MTTEKIRRTINFAMNSNHRLPKLQSRSFRGQNLRRVGFSGADLRHTDFTDAI